MGLNSRRSFNFPNAATVLCSSKRVVKNWKKASTLLGRDCHGHDRIQSETWNGFFLKYENRMHRNTSAGDSFGGAPEVGVYRYVSQKGALLDRFVSAKNRHSGETIRGIRGPETTDRFRRTRYDQPPTEPARGIHVRDLALRDPKIL